MSNITRSAAGAHLQNHQYLGVPYTPMANSTLNQDLKIEAAQTPAEGDIFGLKFYVFGNRGHRTEVGSDGIILTESNMHQPTDAGLFGKLPMVVRLPENDLSVAQRAQYRLREVREIGGVVYILYWGKLLDLSASTPIMEIRDKDTGNAVPFNYEPSNLRPEPQPIPSGMAMTASGQYISSSSKVKIIFTEFDIDELMNAARIMFGRDAYAIISEIGLVHAIDRRITIDSNGSSVPFMESICSQITSFAASHIALKFLNKNHTITLDVGATEPLFKLTPISS